MPDEHPFDAAWCRSRAACRRRDRHRLHTVAQELAARLQSSGGGEGEQEGQAQPQQQDPWEQASVPAKVARPISEGVFQHEVPADRIPLLTNAMHWGYATGWGAVDGLAQGSIHAPTLDSFKPPELPADSN